MGAKTYNNNHNNKEKKIAYIFNIQRRCKQKKSGIEKNANDIKIIYHARFI